MPVPKRKGGKGDGNSMPAKPKVSPQVAAKGNPVRLPVTRIGRRGQ